MELEELHLAGCPKATHRGVGAIVSSNSRGIISLGLEGLSPAFVGIHVLNALLYTL
jgi:hypothetical protein